MIPNEQQIKAAQDRIEAFAALSNDHKCDALDYREVELESLTWTERSVLLDSEYAAEKITADTYWANQPLPKIDEFSSESEKEIYDRIVTATQ